MLANCQLGNYKLAKCHVGELPVGEFFMLGNCNVGRSVMLANCHVSELSCCRNVMLANCHVTTLYSILQYEIVVFLYVTVHGTFVFCRGIAVRAHVVS
jgi:hypothetical protein